MNEVFDVEHLKKTYFTLAAPVVLGLLVTLIYNLADTFFIARTQNTNLIAGVSLCSPVFTTLMAFGNIYGQGGSSLISRLIGQNDKDGTKRVSSFCFYLAIATGIVIGVLMLIFNRPLLTLIGANEETYVYASEYFIVLAIGAPATVLSFIHSNLLRCEGLAGLSMVGSMFGSVLNIILDPILIFGFSMGAKGAAIATVLGYLSSDIFFLIVLAKKSSWLSVSPSVCRICGDWTWQIFGVGFTAAITNIMQSMVMVVQNQFLLPYGNDKIAAMGIVLKISMIAILVLTGFAFGGVPLYGYLYGAGLVKKIRELISFCLKFLCSLSLILTLVLCIFAPLLMRMFVNDAGLILDGSYMLRLQIACTVFAAVVLLFTVLFQASGKIIPALIMSLSRQGVLFLLVLVILKFILGYTGVLAAQAVADVLSAAVGLVLYKRTFRLEEQA